MLLLDPMMDFWTKLEAGILWSILIDSVLRSKSEGRGASSPLLMTHPDLRIME